MSLKFGKGEVSAVAAVLDADHESVDKAALACLAVMEDIFEKRAKFTVVGQLSGRHGRPNIPPADKEAIKLALGWFSTEGDARSAANSMWYSTRSGDTFRTWVLNTFHGTAADLHSDRKEKYVALEAKQADDKRARQKADIAKRDEDMRARAERFAHLYADPTWPCPSKSVPTCSHQPTCK